MPILLSMSAILQVVIGIHTFNIELVGLELIISKECHFNEQR